MSEGNVEAREGSYRKIPQIEKNPYFFPIDCSECLGTLINYFGCIVIIIFIVLMNGMFTSTTRLIVIIDMST